MRRKLEGVVRVPPQWPQMPSEESWEQPRLCCHLNLIKSDILQCHGAMSFYTNMHIMKTILYNISITPGKKSIINVHNYIRTMRIVPTQIKLSVADQECGFSFTNLLK